MLTWQAKAQDMVGAGARRTCVPSLRACQGAAFVAFEDDKMWDIAGDIKVEVYRGVPCAKQRMCHAWVNTSCLQLDMNGQAQLTLCQQDLDKVGSTCPHVLELRMLLQSSNRIEGSASCHNRHALHMQSHPSVNNFEI